MSTHAVGDKAGAAPVRKSGRAIIEVATALGVLAVLGGVAVPQVATVPATHRLPTPSAATAALGQELRIAVARAHAVWLTEQQPNAVDIDNRRIGMVHGYPDKGSMADMLTAGEGFAYEARHGEFRWLGPGGASSSDCAVSYEPPSGDGLAPRIAVATDGCWP